MGYAISYGPKLDCEKKRHKGTFSAHVAAVMVILAAAVCVHFAFPGAVQRVRSVLLPGFGDHTVTALAEMVERVEDGERLDSAVSAFCQEIMDNAEIQD